MNEDGALTFPEGFVWGAATAAYQIEGHRRADGGGESIWDVFARAGGTLNGDDGDIAADHYRRYPEDHRLARDLGLQGLRMSFSWPRISPMVLPVATRRDSTTTIASWIRFSRTALFPWLRSITGSSPGAGRGGGLAEP